jgi:hypothetical protein
MAIALYLKPGTAGRKLILETVPSPMHGRITEHHPANRRELPKRADLVLHCGRGSPSSRSEWFAAQLGAPLVCLPEAIDWVQAQLEQGSGHGKTYVLVDAVLHKMQAIV